MNNINLVTDKKNFTKFYIFPYGVFINFPWYRGVKNSSTLAILFESRKHVEIVSPSFSQASTRFSLYYICLRYFTVRYSFHWRSSWRQENRINKARTREDLKSIQSERCARCRNTTKANDRLLILAIATLNSLPVHADTWESMKQPICRIAFPPWSWFYSWNYIHLSRKGFWRKYGVNDSLATR